jgi:hypothetical protein
MQRVKKSKYPEKSSSASEVSDPFHRFEAAQKVIQGIIFTLQDISKIPRRKIHLKYDSSLDEIDKVCNRLVKLKENLRSARSLTRSAKSPPSPPKPPSSPPKPPSSPPKETEVVQLPSARDFQKIVEDVLLENYLELSEEDTDMNLEVIKTPEKEIIIKERPASPSSSETVLDSDQAASGDSEVPPKTPKGDTEDLYIPEKDKDFQESEVPPEPERKINCEYASCLGNFAFKNKYELFSHLVTDHTDFTHYRDRLWCTRCKKIIPYYFFSLNSTSCRSCKKITCGSCGREFSSDRNRLKHKERMKKYGGCGNKKVRANFELLLQRHCEKIFEATKYKFDISGEADMLNEHLIAEIKHISKFKHAFGQLETYLFELTEYKKKVLPPGFRKIIILFSNPGDKVDYKDLDFIRKFCRTKGIELYFARIIKVNDNRTSISWEGGNPRRPPRIQPQAYQNCSNT